MESNLEVSPLTRHKKDTAWEHCQIFKDEERVHIKCRYCAKVFKGGGIHRFKEHLAGRKNGVRVCPQVPLDVSLLMQRNLDVVTGKQRNQQKMIQEEVSHVSSPLSEMETFTIQYDNLEPSPTTHRKKDMAWSHCQTFKNGGRVQIKCNYCAKVFKGGGIHRFKVHLAGLKGEAPICDRVPPDVLLLMKQSFDETPGKQRKTQISTPAEAKSVGSPPNDAEKFANLFDDVSPRTMDIKALNSVEPNSNSSIDQEGVGKQNVDRRKRGRPKISGVAHDANALNALSSKRMINPIHMTMGRFLYDIGANLDALNSAYYKPFMDVTSGTSANALSRIDLHGCILKNLVEEVKNDIDQYKKVWWRTGCSILVEEWSSEVGRTMLNFLVCCSQGTVFLKSVDISHIMYAADGLYRLLKEVVEEVGAGHVLQVITNGEEHYIIAGKRLMDTFPTLYWAPCATHCINLILEDFGKLEWINAIIEQAKSVTRFIYNHSAVLNLMRKFTFGNDIVQQGVTRSATNFATLKRMSDLKLNLQTMVTSQEWMECPYSKQVGGLAMLDIISNQSFWSSCILIIRLTSPLLRVLGIISCGKRATMGYVFAGMYRAKETIKKEHVKSEDYMVYWNIIGHRWEQQQQHPLHIAGFFLNPKFFYSIEGDMDGDILSRVFDCIERLVPEVEVQDKVVKELNLYKNAVGDLGRKMAIRARETLFPAEWWSTYGAGCPNLARLAVRILSQSCSSMGRKLNHIPFDKVHNTRNWLEHQRLRDLVFVQYNLRLKQMDEEKENQISADPISYENISIVEDWITPNEFCLPDEGSLDWMALVPHSSNTMLLGSLNDETEDLGGGFDDQEIFNGLK